MLEDILPLNAAGLKNVIIILKVHSLHPSNRSKLMFSPRPSPGEELTKDTNPKELLL